MKQKIGILTVYTGCMFAGKTDALIKKIAEINQQKINFLVFKPKIDFRSGTNQIKSKTGLTWPACAFNSTSELKKILTVEKNYQVIFIDEAQFFSDTILVIIDDLLNNGIDVYIAGLDRGFSDNNLPSMNRILALADTVKKFFAICKICGGRANKSQRIDYNKNPVSYAVAIKNEKDLVGGDDYYEPRCRNCFVRFF